MARGIKAYVDSGQAEATPTMGPDKTSVLISTIFVGMGLLVPTAIRSRPILRSGR